MIFNAFFDDHVPGQPLIRKRLDLSHRYMERFNFVLWHHIAGSFSGGWARGLNLVQFKLKYSQ